jgi:hypothetical protein
MWKIYFPLQAKAQFTSHLKIDTYVAIFLKPKKTAGLLAHLNGLLTSFMAF